MGTVACRPSTNTIEPAGAPVTVICVGRRGISMPAPEELQADRQTNIANARTFNRRSRTSFAVSLARTIAASLLEYCTVVAVAPI